MIAIGNLFYQHAVIFEILWVVTPLVLYLRGGSQFFSRISWVWNFSLWVFLGSRIFSRWYFVSSKFFLVGILWVQFFFLMANFVIQRSSVAACMRKSDWRQKYRNTSQTTYSFSNRFQQLLIVYWQIYFTFFLTPISVTTLKINLIN